MSPESQRPAASEAPVDSARVEIRAIRREEVPRVWELLRGLAEYERLTDFLSGNAAMLEAALFGDGPRLGGLVAIDGKRFLGYALFYPVFGSFRARWRLWLEDLYVAPEARGHGVGQALMAELARIASARGFASVDWEVLDWNEPALEFYRARGARPLGGGWTRYRLEGEAMAKLAGDATQ
jgi:ribosomal protein S18 acetylase RimI-like enzyme